MVLSRCGILASSKLNFCISRNFPSSIRWFASPVSSSKLVDVAVNDKTGVATVTLQRPPVNSLNFELLTEFTTVLKQLEESKSRGMILTSAMPTVFSAGLDIMEMYKPNPDRFKAFWTALQDMWLTLYATPYPTVAAINGHSPAGGCLLAISCEYRIMVGPQYTIGLNETQLGIVAPEWLQVAFCNILFTRQAELALMLGTLFKTQEALDIGLIDEMAFDKNDAIKKSEEFLLRTSKIPQHPRYLTKISQRQNVISKMLGKRDEDREIMFSNVRTQAFEDAAQRFLFQDSYRNVLPPRQAELALIIGRMFKTEEALQAGLIDEVASDKADAVQKAEAFLANTSKIPQRARYSTKLSIRQEALKRLQKKREQELELVFAFTAQPAVQKGLEAYLASLKKNSEKELMS